jgi:hypothetical protein
MQTCYQHYAFIIFVSDRHSQAKTTGTNQWERAEISDTEGKFDNPGSAVGLAKQNPALITKGNISSRPDNQHSSRGPRGYS